MKLTPDYLKFKSYRKNSLNSRLWRAWPRLMSRLQGHRSYSLSDGPTRRQPGQPVLHWIRFGRVGASHYLLAADPAWRAVLKHHGRSGGEE